MESIRALSTAISEDLSEASVWMAEPKLDKSLTNPGKSDFKIPVAPTILALVSIKSDCLSNIIFVGFDINFKTFFY